MSKSRTIYALTTVLDNYKPRYVGKTIKDQPSKRLAQHIRFAVLGKVWRVYRWMRARLAAGHEIIMLCLERNAPLGAEAHWISLMRQRHDNLMNTNSTPNEHGEGQALSEAHKAAISKGLRESGSLNLHNLGKHHSEEHRAAISRGLLASGRDYTEMAKKASLRMLGTKASPEAIAAMKAAVRPGWSEERRIAFAITNASAETREKRAESARRRWQREGERERIIAAQNEGKRKRK